MEGKVAEAEVDDPGHAGGAVPKRARESTEGVEEDIVDGSEDELDEKLCGPRRLVHGRYMTRRQASGAYPGVVTN